MEEINNKKALVVFSGGQDSTTCLGWAKNRYSEVECISFVYNQRHKIEIDQAIKICNLFEVNQKIVDSNDLLNQLCESALLQEGNINSSHIKNDKLPASFVPNRNQFFLTLAHSYAQKIGASVLITGVCQTDYSGYFDCREKFIEKISEATNYGSFGEDVEKYIPILTPLMYLTKSETFKLAQDEGCLDKVIEHSHTCYEGDRTHSHDWGYGCGKCPACLLRKKGYEEFKKSI